MEHENAALREGQALQEADEAADLVNDLHEDRREPVLELLRPVQRRRVRAPTLLP